MKWKSFSSFSSICFVSTFKFTFTLCFHSTVTPGNDKPPPEPLFLANLKPPCVGTAKRTVGKQARFGGTINSFEAIIFVPVTNTSLSWNSFIMKGNIHREFNQWMENY